MAKLEFIKNINPYHVVEPGRKYRGLRSPFKTEVFEVLSIIPDCNYQIAEHIGDEDSTNRAACEKCIKTGLNYRIKYKYLDAAGTHTRARHQFKLDKNIEVARM